MLAITALCLTGDSSSRSEVGNRPYGGARAAALFAQLPTKRCEFLAFYDALYKKGCALFAHPFFISGELEGRISMQNSPTAAWLRILMQTARPCAKVYEGTPNVLAARARRCAALRQSRRKSVTKKEHGSVCFRVLFVLRERRSQIAYSYSLPILTRRS